MLAELRSMPEVPSALEMVDENLLQQIDTLNPNFLGGIVEKPFPKLIVLLEFDNANQRIQKKMAKRATKILSKAQVQYQLETDEQEKEKLWQIRHAAAVVLSHSEGAKKAVPIIEDGVVPSDKFHQYLVGVYDLFAKHNLPISVWGHAGDANLHIEPFLDLSQIGDRQKVFKLIDEYHDLVISLGGSTSAEHGDGRLRGPYLSKLYGNAMYEVFQKAKLIFDPHGTLNPGVKVDVTLEDVKPLLRHEYSIEHLAHHLPRS